MLGLPHLRHLLVIGVLINLAFCSGCKFTGKRTAWSNGECKYTQAIQSLGTVSSTRTSVSRPCNDDPTATALIKRASMLEAAHDPTCVDLYFAATYRNWQSVASVGDQLSNDDLLRESQAYHASLAKLLVTAQRYGRLDPVTGLQVFDGDQSLVIPVELHGFAWSAEDFNDLELVGEYELAKHAKATRSEGIGVPLVVRRKRCETESFFRKVHPFAATAVLRTRCLLDAASAVIAGGNLPEQELVLEFYNPANNTHLTGMPQRWTLARDLTAPLAWTVSATPNNPVREFLRPNANHAGAQLVMLEPYQPGKIPVVFVHGLLSDPSTWITMGNALRAHDGFANVIRYGPFVIQPGFHSL